MKRPLLPCLATTRLLAFAIVLTTTPLFADTFWTAIYHNVPAVSGNDVPGLAAKFKPGTGTTQFDRIYVSPNGNFAFVAFTDQATTNDEILIVNGTVAAQEGDALDFAPGEHIGLLDTQLGINDSGAYAFATNSDGDTATDEYIVTGTLIGGQTKAAQEGDSADPPIAGATVGSTLESPVILADGTVGFSSDNMGGLVATENDAVFLGNTLLAQEGITIPPGQIGTETWENFDLSDFFVTPNGNHYLIQGDLTGSTTSDDVLAYDGKVVIQEDTIIPGSGFTDPVDGSGIVGSFLDPAGNWFARGNNDTSEQDWVVRSGKVVAKTGSPIVDGATEVWDDTDFSDCFFMHAGNGNGDYIVGGVTDAASATNGVLVFFDKFGHGMVLAREGDPVDLDGNGMMDDNAFFDTFGNDDIGITDNRTVYIVATIKDNTETRIGQGLIATNILATYRPDMTMGEKRSFSSQKGNNQYGNKTVRFTSASRKQTLFLTLGNDGDISDTIVGSFSGLRGKFKIKIKQLGGGNVTAAWKRKNHLVSLESDRIASYRIILRRPGSETRSLSNLKFRGASGNSPGQTDQMKAKVKWEQ